MTLLDFILFFVFSIFVLFVFFRDDNCRRGVKEFIEDSEAIEGTIYPALRKEPWNHCIWWRAKAHVVSLPSLLV